MDADESYRLPRRLSSSNDNINPEVLSFCHSIIKFDVATIGVADIVSRQLPFPLLLPVAVSVAVILRCDNDASLVGGEVSDDVTPTFVVVDAQGDDEVLAGVGQETKRPARPAAAHVKHVRSVNVIPGSAVSIMPHGLLDDAEGCVPVGMVDLRGDPVTRSRRNSETVDKKQCRQRVHVFWW